MKINSIFQQQKMLGDFNPNNTGKSTQFTAEFSNINFVIVYVDCNVTI